MEIDLKLLVLDDDDVDRMTIIRGLKKAGVNANFEEFSDTMSALEALKTHHFDCAFFDYNLPDGDGLSLLRQVRAEQINTPIVILTGQGDEQLVVEFMRAGASDYIPKAKMSSDVLERSLRSAIRVSQAEQERYLAEQALKQSNDEIVTILESISDAFFAVNSDWCFSYLNSQAENLLQAKQDDLLGHNIWEKLPDAAFWLEDKFRTAMQSKVAVNAEGYYSPISRWLEVQVYPSEQGLSVYFRDVTERKEAEEKLNYLATHDTLTGLANRLVLIDRINQSISRLPWHNRIVAILFIDLDRFKLVNDTMGHTMGDKLLCSVAERLRNSIRTGDTVARLGGDEFVIVLTDVAKSNEVTLVAEKIRSILSKPYQIKDQEIVVTASIGISLYPEDGHDSDILIRNADAAMYRAKAQGKNNIQLYTPSMNKQAIDRLNLESQLRKALENEEFRVFYQPLINSHNGKIIGMEALVRWMHKDQGIIPPLKFLSLAEETGIIIPLGEWIFDTACSQLHRWHQAGFEDLRIAVNLTNRQFKHPDLLKLVSDTLKNNKIKANHLELELNEDIVMNNIKSSCNKINELREMQVRLAIDDFGTGYSLAQLKLFAVDTLKIDKSFIQDVTHTHQNSAIVASIIELAHSLNLEVIAEGVEEQEQFEVLRKQQCDIVQGYLFSHPVPEDKFTKILEFDFGSSLPHSNVAKNT